MKNININYPTNVAFTTEIKGIVDDYIKSSYTLIVNNLNYDHIHFTKIDNLEGTYEEARYSLINAFVAEDGTTFSTTIEITVYDSELLMVIRAI